MSREKETILVKPGRDSQNILRNRIRISLLENMTQVFLGEIQGIKKEKRKDFSKTIFLLNLETELLLWSKVFIYISNVYFDVEGPQGGVKNKLLFCSSELSKWSGEASRRLLSQLKSGARVTCVQTNTL